MGRYLYVGPYDLVELPDGSKVQQGGIVETSLDDHIAYLNQRGFHIFREVGAAGEPPATAPVEVSEPAPEEPPAQ